jgi:hypothetical protein
MSWHTPEGITQAATAELLEGIQQLSTPADVARALRVALVVVNSWIASGALHTTGAMIDRRDLERFLRGRGHA